MMNWIKINCDGGCKPTNPGNKYGSFEVQLNQVQVFKASRIELGYGTSNEAEFDILIEALKWTHENLLLAGLPPSKYILTVFTDSRIMANRINSRNVSGKSEPARRMAALTKQTLMRMNIFGSWKMVWHRRQNNVDRFGH